MEDEVTPITQSDIPASVESPTPTSTPEPESASPPPAAKEAPYHPGTMAERINKRAEAVIRKRGTDGKFQPGTEPAPKTDSTSEPKEAPQASPQAAPPASTEPKATEWKPDFKFRFAAEGKPKQEGEIPEFLRESVKTPEHEKQIREVFEKAHGLDFVKPLFQRTREELQKTQQAHQTVMAGINDLREDYKRGDFDSFFDRLKIPQERVLQWVAEKVNYMELPPEQRAVVDARRQAEQRALDAERQLAQTQGNYMEQARQAKAFALDSSLTRPEVSAIAQAFDSLIGKHGAFKELVANHGETTWYRSQGQVDLTPDQAIEQVIAQYGFQAATPASTPSPAQTAATPPPAPQGQAPGGPPPAPHQVPKVIPHVAAGAGSPAAGRPRSKSLADLRKRHDELLKASG